MATPPSPTAPPALSLSLCVCFLSLCSTFLLYWCIVPDSRRNPPTSLPSLFTPTPTPLASRAGCQLLKHLTTSLDSVHQVLLNGVSAAPVLLASAWISSVCLSGCTDTQLYLGLLLLLLNLFIIIGIKRIRNCLLSSVVGSACLSNRCCICRLSQSVS